MKEYTLRDAGSEMMGPVCADGKMEKEKWYQGMGFDIKALPEIGMWQVGEEYFLIVKVKEVNHSLREDKEGAQESADFEVLSVGAYNPEVDKYGEEVSKRLKLK